MSISSEITRLQQAKQQIAAAIAEKGVSVPDDALMDDMAGLISAISTSASGDSGSGYEFRSGQFTYSEFIVPGSNYTVFDHGFDSVPDYIFCWLVIDENTLDLATGTGQSYWTLLIRHCPDGNVHLRTNHTNSPYRTSYIGVGNALNTANKCEITDTSVISNTGSYGGFYQTYNWIALRKVA